MVTEWRIESALSLMSCTKELPRLAPSDDDEMKSSRNSFSPPRSLASSASSARGPLRLYDLRARRAIMYSLRSDTAKKIFAVLRINLRATILPL